MKKFLFLFLLICSQAHSLEVFYFGGQNSTETALDEQLYEFLSDPKKSCSRSYVSSNNVTMFVGRYLDAHHWVDRAQRPFVYQNIQYRHVLRPPYDFDKYTALDQVMHDYKRNSERRVIFQFGDNTLYNNMFGHFKQNMLKMINKLEVRSRNCLIIAPIAFIRNDMVPMKNEIFRQIIEIRKQNICQIVAYEHKSSEPFPLEDDGFHPTADGYEMWANQLKEKICDSALFHLEGKDSTGLQWQ